MDKQASFYKALKNAKVYGWMGCAPGQLSVNTAYNYLLKVEVKSDMQAYKALKAAKAQLAAE